MPPVSVVVDLPRHLTGHEEFLLVDPRGFTPRSTCGFLRTREPKSSTIRKWVRVYSAGGNQAKLDFVMLYLASWPLLIVRVMETLKAAQGNAKPPKCNGSVFAGSAPSPNRFV